MAARLQSLATADRFGGPSFGFASLYLPHDPWPPPATGRSCARRRQAQSGLRVIRAKLVTFYCSPDLRNGIFAARITLTRATSLELILLHTHPSIPLSETPLR